jgi:proteasome accessory factor B
MSQEVELEPYLLKEHNKRWYLIGKIPMKQNDNTNYLTYALDRIVSIHWEKPSREFIRDQSFNPEIYWEHSVGLFRGEPKKVTFQLKNDFMNNIDFIKTSPIHKSQKITKIDEQWIEVELFIYPSYELVRELRKFGVNNIRNLKPESIQI